MQDAKENELMKVLNKIQEKKNEIQMVNEKIVSVENFIDSTKQQKDRIQDELINFLKMILKSEQLL